MARTIGRVLTCFLLLFAAVLQAHTSTTAAAGRDEQGAQREAPASALPPEDAVDITLGQAAAPLNGPWKFTVGDSPIDPKTGQLMWAEPGFDDSHWETVDLTPKEGTVSPIAGSSGYVPGWTARGHVDYWGYAWYRIRIRCQSQSNRPLALAGPADVDDGYQAFADGKLLGSFGNFSGTHPVIYYTQPFQFRLPWSCQQASAAQVVAFRFWMEPLSLLNVPDAGGMHSAPLLGEASVIGLHFQSQWLELIRGYLIDAAEAAVFALLAVVAFSLILFDRSDPVYLWIGLLFLTTAALNAWNSAVAWTQWIPVRVDLVVYGTAIGGLYALWVMVWWVWFGREGFRWLPGVLLGLAALSALSGILGQETIPGLVSHPNALRLYSLNQGLTFVFFGLLAWVVIDGIRRRGLDGWLVLPVILLRGVAAFNTDLVRSHVFSNWLPFGVMVHPSAIANFLVVVVIALLLLRRLLQSVKRQREMALDVKQAQEVQQVILPERRIALPGFAIETEYRPALQVGGDFFQIIPHSSDGSLLIVAGDVAGKGLKAGMLVALLIGAIRSTAETGSDPAAILAALNRRLLGAVTPAPPAWLCALPRMAA
jgi:stage II sporulation SpoE-like protein